MVKPKLFLMTMAALFVSLTSCVDDNSNQADTARYKVTFDATWSAGSHPVRFPSNPHFSGLVGAVHSDQSELWSRGKLSSPGIKLMAETGSKTALLSEVDELIQRNIAFSRLSGGGIGQSPSQVSLEFEVNKDFPLVSLVSMIAPSPDWFIGVSSLNLLESDDWVEFKEVDLRVYDAGTDSGRTFVSANSNTNPRRAITRLSTDSSDSDFVNGIPYVGRLTFERIE